MHRIACIRTGACMVMGLLITLAMVHGGQADYNNPMCPDKETAVYWMDQGGFFCTYGNFKAAVNAYEKALAFEPNKAEAHFDIGLALGELGDYAKAIASIERAIALRPEEARYRYGRAWILLRAGQPEEARPELLKAAEMGSSEAKEYLKGRDASR